MQEAALGEGLLSKGAPAPSLRWEGVTDKPQVPWNLWQGHFCPPSPVTARLALGYPHPRRDAPIWEARKVEPFGFEPAWAQPHGQRCSRQY